MLQNKFLPTFNKVSKYLPTWESLDEHQIPKWFIDAKFGIFIHWGPYSVPAWAPKQNETGEYYNNTVGNHPYAEIYGYGMLYKDSKVWKHHKKVYGPGFQYEDFFPKFTAEKWNPEQWAKLFKQIGAKYVVLVTKHSDGYCMFDSKLTDRTSVKTGPKRDITGDLFKELRKENLKVGLYYSVTFDWYYRNFPHVIYKQYTHGQIQELVDNYQPDILWSDDYWKPIEKSCADTWGSKEMISYFYNNSKDPAEVLTNDRWGAEVDGKQIGDFSTPEYTPLPDIQEFYWETNRGIGRSYGYNKEETEEDYSSSDDLIFLLADVVSKNGNLLLNVGPKSDGTLDEIQARRLLDIGEWLEINEEAIFESRPWIEAEGLTSNNSKIRFTTKNDKLYAIVFGENSNNFYIQNMYTNPNTQISLFSKHAKLGVSFKQEGNKLNINIPNNFDYKIAFVLEFSEKPYLLQNERISHINEADAGKIYRRLGYLKVNL